jgi:microcystin-dependent protein
MGFLEDLKNGDIKSIILVILIVLIFNLYWCVSSNARSTRRSLCKDKEPMADVSNDIKEAVKQVYLADVEAIRNLSEVATKLNNKEGVTIPGNLTVSGTFTSNYLPKGSIVAYNQGSAPSGWTLCDGSNGSPDLRNKFVLGWGNRGVGTTGGEENVTLGVHQMPQHQHNVNGDTDSKGAKSFGGAKAQGNAGYWHLIGVGGQPYGGVQTADDHTHNININSSYVGGNAAHNNMPPFYVLTYIMKL